MMRVSVRLAVLRMLRCKSSVLCHVAALVAIMLPMLIILGLKYGIVTSMKERLLSNPASMELRMMDAMPLTPERVEQLRALPGVGFMLPSVSSLYSQAELLAPDGRTLMSLPVAPTSAGDPLLRLSGTPEPGENEVVLSEAVANRCKLSAGDFVEFQVARNARRELLKLKFRVAGILPRRFVQPPRAFLPLQHTVAIQEFVVRGLGVPGHPAPVDGRAVYHGVLLPPDASEQQISHLAEFLPGWTRAVTTEDSHPGVKPGVTVFSVSAAGLGKSAAELDALQHNSDCRLQPWCLPVQAQLQVGKSISRVEVLSSGMYDGQANVCGTPPSVLLPAGLISEDGQGVELLVSSPQGQSRIYCVARQVPHLAGNQVQVSPQLAAILHRAAGQLLLWDYRVGALRHPVVEFYSLRIYADRLENVAVLHEALRNAGISCRAKLAVVEQVLSLERSLNTLFLVISGGAGLGAVISFGMSLFNSTELHRRDYALFRLLGAGKFVLPLVPMLEASVTALLAVVFSLGLFYAGQQLIGMLFAYSLAESATATALCRLTWTHQIMFTLLALVTAWVASGAAALKTLSISPSEILRES